MRYPLIEAATAALFLLCLLEFGLTPRGVAAAVLCFLLLGLAATDAETFRLPDTLTLPGIVLGVIASAFVPVEGPSPRLHWESAAAALLWAACAASLILLIRGLYWLIRRKEGIGMGDAKLLAMIAAWLGWQQTLLTFFLAVIGAATYGVILIVSRRKTNDAPHHAARVPLGAFLSAAGIFALFRGQAILEWYLRFFR